jgi:hypothetical protein
VSEEYWRDEMFWDVFTIGLWSNRIGYRLSSAVNILLRKVLFAPVSDSDYTITTTR